METYGIISLLPVLVVIVTAIISKRALEALTLGTIVASIIIAKADGGQHSSQLFRLRSATLHTTSSCSVCSEQ